MRKILVSSLMAGGLVWSLVIENGGDRGILVANSQNNPELAADIPSDLICWYQPGSLSATSNVVQTEVLLGTETVVRVVPKITYVKKDGTFTIDIEALNVSDLGAAQLYLYFDKNKVNITPYGTPSKGSLFGGGAWTVDPLIERDKGYIYICDVLLSGSGNGTGTLVEKIIFSSLVDDPTSEFVFGTITLLKSDFITEIPYTTEQGSIFPYLLDHFDLLAPIDVIAGRAWTMTITVKDQQNNVYKDYKGIPIISVNPGTISYQISKFSNGVGIATITRYQVGTMVLTVKDSENPSVSTQIPSIMVRYLCDFGNSFISNDPDNKIVFEDLVWFARYWRAYYSGGTPSTWAKGDVGRQQMSGNPPYIISEPNGKVDFWDLVIFVRMWRWSQGKGKPMALEAPKFSLSQEKLEAEKGEEFNVNITANANNLLGVNIRLDYDPAKIELISLEEGDYFKKQNLALKDNTISLASLEDMNGISKEAPLSNARFKLKDENASRIKIKIFYLQAGDDVKETELEVMVEPLDPPPYSALFQSVPNPAKDSVFIPFQLAEAGETKLTIYNILGQVVKEIGPEFKPRGYYTLKNKKALSWDLKNNAGQKVANGLYFYKLSSGKFFDVKSMVISR
ncbi:MAG: cohesin domain-containing protein [bacterium]